MYVDGPKLEWLPQPRIRFLWLIPITERERDFKAASGLEALEQAFEDREFDDLDFGRESVA